ncbi:hypothetical protein ACCO45_005414 [Purpureocillium lilacinum]|uniref:Uncharacterized protein n=1 Tax=Purpureocillium lilacinum TaxID=33203 RepID=A0ACC4DW29_PURLI
MSSAGQLNDDDADVLSSGGGTEASSSVAAAASSRRRSHRKSRDGCVECKKRHIRCDESRPDCLNCEKAARRLRNEAAAAASSSLDPSTPSMDVDSPIEALRQQRDRQQQRVSQRHQPTDEADVASLRRSQSRSAAPSEPPLRAPSSHEETTALPGPSLLERGDDPLESHGHDRPLFTVQHLRFLHHAGTAMGHGVMAHPHTGRILDIAVRRAVDAPFLLDEVLALSALHLAATLADDSSNGSSPGDHPNNNSNYHPPSPTYIASLRNQSTELQTRALASFTRHSLSVDLNDAESAIPRFLFAAVLSLHNLAETLETVRHLQSSDFHVFIHKLADCLGLHRGIRTVIKPAWNDLINSELEPLLNVTQHANERIIRRREHDAAGGECAHLLALLDASDLGSATDRACRDAVERLQWAFDLYSDTDADAGSAAASAFSVTVCAEYVDVLRRLQPEALVILAHYGVLLHRHRHLWLYRDAGARMIGAISRHLGTYWRDAMTWPLQQLETDR